MQPLRTLMKDDDELHTVFPPLTLSGGKELNIGTYSQQLLRNPIPPCVLNTSLRSDIVNRVEYLRKYQAPTASMIDRIVVHISLPGKRLGVGYSTWACKYFKLLACMATRKKEKKRIKKNLETHKIRRTGLNYMFCFWSSSVSMEVRWWWGLSWLQNKAYSMGKKNSTCMVDAYDSAYMDSEVNHLNEYVFVNVWLSNMIVCMNARVYAVFTPCVCLSC